MRKHQALYRGLPRHAPTVACGHVVRAWPLDRKRAIQDRHIRVAFNDLRMSDVGTEPHNRSLPLTGGIFDIFVEVFQKLFPGGEGLLSLTLPEAILDTGIEIDITLPGKKRQRLELLSGGERSLCATAFLFSLLKVKPSPLVVLDEVDAPLDGRNVERYIEMLREFMGSTQFILVTHNPTTIEAAPVWLGVTMQEPGVSTLVPARMPALETHTNGHAKIEALAVVEAG